MPEIGNTSPSTKSGTIPRSQAPFLADALIEDGYEISDFGETIGDPESQEIIRELIARIRELMGKNEMLYRGLRFQIEHAAKLSGVFEFPQEMQAEKLKEIRAELAVKIAEIMPNES